MKIKQILKNKWGWAGAIVGTLVVLKDLDFLMNPGGPNKPLLNYIQSLYGATEVSSMFNTFAPYILIIVLGFISGLILQKIYRRIR